MNAEVSAPNGFQQITEDDACPGDDGASDHAPFVAPEDYDRPEPDSDASGGPATFTRARVVQGPADPLRRVTDPAKPPEAWMTKLLWVKRSEGHAKAKVEWYTPKSCVANATTILGNDARWAGVIARNDFAEVDVIMREPPWHSDDRKGSRVGPWTDADTTRLRSWLDRAYGIVLGPNDLEQVVSVVAEANRFHPVRDYLQRLTWDGTERLATMLCAYFAAPDNDYSRAIGALWMTSAVARAMAPGCQVDCLLILEGPQGKRKNAALRALVPDPALYSETGIVIGQKDSYQSLHGVWIYVIDELASLKGRDVEKVKSFVSSPKDHFRAPYGRRFRDYPRQNVFAGTTNEERYFPDRTGNRRARSTSSALLPTAISSGRRPSPATAAETSGMRTRPRYGRSARRSRRSAFRATRGRSSSRSGSRPRPAWPTTTKADHRTCRGSLPRKA